MKRLICYFKEHQRGETAHREHRWFISCKRCGYVVSYVSPRARLVGEEIRLGFTGD